MKVFLFYRKNGKFRAVEQGSIEIAELESRHYQNLQVKIEAKNQEEAVKKFKKEQNGFNNDLKHYTYSIAFGCVIAVVGAIIYFLKD